MNFEVVVEPAAESDIRAAFEWYEEQVPSLGHEFLVSLRSCFGRLERTPAIYKYFLEPVRRANIDRFPFGVLFVIREEFVFVLGVFHHKRNPASWIRRARIWGRT
jgi:plasmid stabilization system protein ParE